MVARKVFDAPAKINLYLEVLGRRPDGYHELSMIMQRISLADRIEITVGGSAGVHVSCEGLSLSAGEENIAARAARRILDLAQRSEGVEIKIDKQIPVAAGLGGGSSDAATVLMGLNEMLGLELSQERLMREGAYLGADVPFFVFGRPAWARGIGDRLQEVEGIPRLWYVLVNPGVAVSTAWVYGNLGLTSMGGEAKLPGFFGTASEIVSNFRNDLERVTMSRYPVIAEIKTRLVSEGALGALMSGSGPTVFGVFSDEIVAREAASRIASESGWKVFVVSSV